MNATSLCIALAQLNPAIGDIAGNAAKVLAARAPAHAAGAELLVLPELFLSGAPALDLLASPAFQDACRRACEELARETADGGPAILIGLPWREEGRLYNAYALLDGGVIQSVRFKAALCDRGIRDETRMLARGPLPGPMLFRDKVRLGPVIGEDILSDDVVECLAETGTEILLAPCASPYHRDVCDIRMNLAVARIVESGLPLVQLNQVGGQDELVFDGASFVLNGDRTLAWQLPAFREEIALTQWQRESGNWRCSPGDIAAIETGDEADYAAIVLSLRDYIGKTGAAGAAIEVCGLLEASLCAVLAVDALGADRVVCLAMTSASGGQDTAEDPQTGLHPLGARLETVSLAPLARALETALADSAAYAPSDAMRADLADRARGVILAARSAALGYVLLATRNRSAMACGASLVHGAPDTSFQPLKDVSATQAHRLAALRNRWRPAAALGPDGPVVPELGPAPAGRLDDILDLLMDEVGVFDVVALGHELETVKSVERGLRSTQRARHDAIPGVRLSAKAVNGESRYPIAHGFNDDGEPRLEPDQALTKGGRAAGNG